LLAVPIIGFAAFGMLGTSFITLVDTYQIREITGGPSSNIQLDFAAEAIRAAAERNGLECKECARPTERGRYEGRGLTMSYEIKSPKSIAFSISGVPTGLFFGGNVQQKMNSLQNDLKAQFGSRFTNLEFVEPIAQQRWR
jgi:hypothetical protein